MAWPWYLLRLLVWRLDRLRARLGRAPRWVSFLLEEAPPALAPPPGPLWQRLLGPGPAAMPVLEEQMRRVAADPRVRGVVVHLRPMSLTAAQADSLRELLAVTRAAGKRVVCWAPSYGTGTYSVACAADELLIQEGGGIGPLGVARTYVFLADSLRRVGLEADLIQVTPYKTAGDMFTRSDLSPEAREMADWLADAALAELLRAVGAGRGLGAGEARALVDHSPYTDLEAERRGAVDGVVGEEDLPARLGAAVVPFAAASRRLRRPPPPRPGPVVGLIRVEGSIVDGRSRRSPLRLPIRLLTGDTAGDLTVVEQARRLAASRRVGAVVLWVDSGGGSATASEAMAAALRSLAARKPLVAAMGSVAASGGYYAAAPAQRVFAQPGTITGSIGVLAGKLVGGGLLDRLLVSRAPVTRGEHADMESSERLFSEAERGRLRESVERSYQVFLERVAGFRGLPLAELEPIAGGRVWTGRQALERRLVDELGGLQAAAADARRRAGLRADAPLVELRPGRREQPPAAPDLAVAVEHGLRLGAALNRTGVWWLCPVAWEGW